MDLLIENIRSFHGMHRIRIAPLTILVGENSSGKTTVLAAMATVADRLRFPFRPAFTEAPYDFGGFESIATYRGGRGGRATSFSLGFAFASDDTVRRQMPLPMAHPAGSPDAISAQARYSNRLGYPTLASFDVREKNAKVQFDLNKMRIVGLLPKGGRDPGMTEVDFAFDAPSNQDQIGPDFGSIYGLVDLAILGRRGDKDDIAWTLNSLYSVLSSAVRELPSAVSIAPIRTRPRRTYDALSETFDPEGTHVPRILARLLNAKTADQKAKALSTALRRFGGESGLFSSIEVKKLGRGASDPFQILVATKGRPVNLNDVGYGVSQALPVVVQAALAAPSDFLLLQQPEVHLHPRAQAALGTFLVDLVASRHKRFVVETHSDYFVDRVRQELANGRIRSSDVNLIFLEKSRGETVVHEIGLDTSGNITSSPPSYRAFFLEEELRLLKRGAVSDVPNS